MLSLSCELTCSQTLEIDGGATDTIFPRVEEWLEESDHIKCIKKLGRISSSYWSLMDFLVCFVFPKQRSRCFAYYKDRGPQLRFLIDSLDREDMENQILNTLEEAWISFCQKTPYYYVPMVYEPRHIDSYFSIVSITA